MGVGMLPDDAPTKGPVVAGRKCCALFQGFEVWRCGGYGFYCQVLVFLFFCPFLIPPIATFVVAS